MSIPSFRNAEDFLAFLKKVAVSPMAQVQGPPNAEFRTIVEKRDLGAAVTIDRAYDDIVVDLWDEIEPIVREECLLSGQVAIGALDNIAANAMCARSPEGFLAVLLNAGLFTLLNKLSKLSVASSDAGSVVYCNRCPGPEVTPELAHQWYLDTCAHYAATGKPQGPQMHLTEPATELHAVQLNVWEVFVLCHEVGHIGAGHLADRDWKPNAALGMVQSSSMDFTHGQELDADLFGYLILRGWYYRNEARKGPEDDRPLLAHVMNLFDLLYLTGSRESTSHPDPLDRIVFLAGTIYGSAFGDGVAASYGRPELLAELLDRPLVPREPPDPGP